MKTNMKTDLSHEARNEQHARNMVARTGVMLRNAQRLLDTLEELMKNSTAVPNPSKGNEPVVPVVEQAKPVEEQPVVEQPVEEQEAPELHVVKDARRSDNKTGYTGVYFSNRERSYVAEVRIRDRYRRKVGFKTPEEAKVVREQMKREILKEIENELNIDKEVKPETKKETNFTYDQKTLNALGRDAWIAWAKEAMSKLAAKLNEEDPFAPTVRETELRTHSRVKLRLHFLRSHMYFDGKTAAEVNAMTQYDILANDRLLRDTFTELVLDKLGGGQEDKETDNEINKGTERKERKQPAQKKPSYKRKTGKAS